MKWFIAALLVLAFAGAPAGAAPSVFIHSTDNAVWWNAEMDAKVLNKRAGPITAEALTSYIADTTIYNEYQICALEAVTNDTFVGLDRKSQEQIDDTEQRIRWRIDAITAEGRKIVAQSVIFEACNDDEIKGAALLVWDAATNEILRWVPIGFRFTQNNQAVPTWALFLLPPIGDELFGFSDCSECGARTNVFYDGRRKHIYTEYNDH